MAKIKISNHAGTEFASIINNPAGSVYADQIYWGQSYLGTTYYEYAFETTEGLLNAINDKIANQNISDSDISNKLSAYLQNNNIIPDLQKGSATKPGTSYVLTDFSVNGHTITPKYSEVPSLAKVGEAPTTGTYYISDFSIDGHVITPVYTELSATAEYVHPAAKDLWATFTIA